MLRCLKVALLVGIASAAPPVLAVVSAPVEAQVAKSGYALPLSLAMEAAAEAVRTCESNGYAVSAAVVIPPASSSCRPRATIRRSTPVIQVFARPTPL